MWELNIWSGVPAPVHQVLDRVVLSKYLSPQLAKFLTDVHEMQECDLIVDLHDSGAGDHGMTGVFVVPSGSTEEIPIDEAFAISPKVVLGQHKFLIRVIVGAGEDSPLVEASTTLLHEFELHVAPATLLFQRLAGTQAGLDDRLGHVLDYLRRTDDHINPDFQDAYVRTSGRMRLAVTGTPLAKWGDDFRQEVVEDALRYFRKYEREHQDAGSAGTKWIDDLAEAVALGGPDALIQTPRPQWAPVPAAGTAAGGDLPAYVATRVSERAGMVDIIDEARRTFAVPVSEVLAVYRDQIVPALQASAPADISDPYRMLAFMKYHGVPSAVALDAIEHTRAAPTGVHVTVSWPPRGMRVLWLSEGERDSWNPETALPESVQKAPGIEHENVIYLDGDVYSARVYDAKPNRVPPGIAFFPYGDKFMGLFKL